MSSPAEHRRDRFMNCEVIRGLTVVTFADDTGPIGEWPWFPRNFQEHVFPLLETPNGNHLLLDFVNIEYLSSETLGKLITLQKQVRQVNGRLGLCGLNSDIRAVFEVTKLDQFFEIFVSQEKALSALSPESGEKPR